MGQQCHDQKQQLVEMLVECAEEKRRLAACICKSREEGVKIMVVELSGCLIL